MIGVLSCVWQRPERLRKTLAMLAAQTVQDFALILINNNPALRDEVDLAVNERDSAFPLLLHHNQANRGPYARLEMMVALRDKFEYFVTIDDDADFGPEWLAAWWAQRDERAVLGWNGFRFRRGGTYWDREQAHVGQSCHYLWGSNLIVPSAMVDDGLLGLPEEYRLCCDDLWLCFYANHVRGFDLRRADIAVRIVEDRKDSYLVHRTKKIALLEQLRRWGWPV